MQKIYIDADYKCHLNNDGTMAEIKTDFFQDKCDYFIEGYRFVPAGCTWVREDGTVFRGEMISPWKNYDLLATAQAQYAANLAESTAAYQEGVNAAYDQ